MLSRTIEAPKNILHAYRLGLKITQPQMAEAMGLSLRGYEELESGRSPIRPLHINAAAYALVKFAAANSGPKSLPFEIEEVIKRAAQNLLIQPALSRR